ncbi:MAG: hypothetical protein ACRCZB_01375 [Bacteroidales bacterium]
MDNQDTMDELEKRLYKILNTAVLVSMIIGFADGAAVSYLLFKIL